jgi:hypothetical protein
LYPENVCKNSQNIILHTNADRICAVFIAGSRSACCMAADTGLFASNF